MAMSSREGTMPLGWIVRVTMQDGTMLLYKAGFFLPSEAENAVKEARGLPGEAYRAVDPITASHGGPVEPHEVAELTS